MINVKVNTDNLRLVAAGLIVGFVVALPMGAQALTNNNQEPVVQQEEEPEVSPSPEPEVVESPEPSPEVVVTPDPVPVPDPVPEVIEPNEESVNEVVPVATLDVAITIAAAEHPGVEVVSAKVKTLGAEKVYKVTFADGWRIYVSADDGEIYVAKDGDNKKRAFYNYAKKNWSKKYGSWKPWSSQYKSHCKHWVDSQEWENATPETTSIPSPEPAEESTASVQRSSESRESRTDRDRDSNRYNRDHRNR